MKKHIYFFIFLSVLFTNNIFALKHVITVANFSFTPSAITNVIVGDTIEWVWLSGNHTTTSANIPSGANSWDAQIDNNNTTFRYKVNVAGTYNYVCTPHAGSGMIASFTASGSTNIQKNMNINDIQLIFNDNSKIRFKINSAEKTEIHLNIIDLTGKLLKEKSYWIDNTDVIEADINDIKSGLYFFSFATNESTIAVKKILKR